MPDVQKFSEAFMCKLNAMSIFKARVRKKEGAGLDS